MDPATVWTVILASQDHSVNVRRTFCLQKILVILETKMHATAKHSSLFPTAAVLSPFDDACGGCHNNGTCETIQGADDLVLMAQCICVGAWTGENCESRSFVDFIAFRVPSCCYLKCVGKDLELLLLFSVPIPMCLDDSFCNGGFCIDSFCTGCPESFTGYTCECKEDLLHQSVLNIPTMIPTLHLFFAQFEILYMFSVLKPFRH